MKKFITLALLALSAPALAMTARPRLPDPTVVTAIPYAEYKVLIDEYNRVNKLWNAAKPSQVFIDTQLAMNSYIGNVEEARQAQAKGNRPGFDAARDRALTDRAEVCTALGTC